MLLVLKILLLAISLLLLDLVQFSLSSIAPFRSFSYNFEPPGFVPLTGLSRVKRVRRASDPTEIIPRGDGELWDRFRNMDNEFVDMFVTPDPANFTEIQDLITENCQEIKNASAPCHSDHTYYNMTVYPNNQTAMDRYYVDMDAFLARPEVLGTKSHDQLTLSYRKAANVKLAFKFPFYGHRLENITIATGGFVYVGDQTHSWLAATQYIAPLMANFDTLSQNSLIKYGDNGTLMIVEWSNVKLRDNKDAGPFIFQMHLWNSGDIYFIYKDVPITVSDIKDHNHPCKLGISDAYLFNHRISQQEAGINAIQVKRVIHEYHRISIPMERITNNTVVVLKAMPTCLDFSDCGSCSNASLKHFNCSWCSPKDRAEDGEPFCSDDNGLNRHRQKWVEGNCGVKNKDVYCDAFKQDSDSKDTSKTSKSSNTTTEPPHPDSVIPLDGKKAGLDKPAEHPTAGGGLTFLMVMIILVICGTAWVLYAYYNPHTPSGQFLIKYRPSKWQIPSSHVRYSASLHM